MALAKSEFEHRTIIGPVDKTINDFLKDAPYGSELIITGDSCAEQKTVVDFPSVKKVAEITSEARHHVVDKLSRSGTVFKEVLTSSPVVRTFRRALKPS